MAVSWEFFMLVATISTLFFVIVNVDGQKLRQIRESDDDDDESCRPMKPEPGTKPPTCCELPLVFRETEEQFKACKQELGMPDHKHPPPPPPSSEEGHGPSPPHHGGHHHHHHPHHGMFSDDTYSLRGLCCVHECSFNKSGLLENEKISRDALQKALDEYLKTDEAWKPMATTMLQKCYEDQMKKFEPENKKCVSGANEFLKCFHRGLFMDCIPEKWTDSTECSDFKAKLGRCPHLMPPGLCHSHKPSQ